ncbi:metallophosphoesterase [Oscillospiraceae bacterium OttesenSCG-928-F05]|nr:metallophosphoesterase [Oscillospiraceae bacterium OttesenSCG-928-F05]
MALYAIGDLHLSLDGSKPMDIFGGSWVGYVEKIKKNLSALGPDDTLVLCGDTSWGIKLEQSEPDFALIHGFPGRKLLLKGNHDYWWTTKAKMDSFFYEHGLSSLNILHNNCYVYEDAALCGTRGWFYEEDDGKGSDKIYKRELARLELSLKEARKTGCARIFCFLHYPPLYGQYKCPEILQMLSDYGVSQCYYGHLHGKSQAAAFGGIYENVRYTLVSGDALDFNPIKILN